MKSKVIAYFLWIISICGCLGLHRFYLRKKKTGFIWLFSGGVVGIGAIYDLFTLGEQVNEVNKILFLEKLVNTPPTIDQIASAVIENEAPVLSVLGTEFHAFPTPKNGVSCPYCDFILERKPQRKVKCPACKNDIYVKSKQTIFANVLLTQENAAVVDCLRQLSNYGVDELDFILAREEMVMKFGEEINPTDVIWSLFKKIIFKTKDSEGLTRVNHLLAVFLTETGKEPRIIVQRALKMRLLKYKGDGLKKVRVLVLNKEMSAICQQMEGKMFSVDQALQEMPLPCPECTYKLDNMINGFCPCSFTSKV